MRVFAFLDVEHPPTAWATMRGMLVSADQAHPDARNDFASYMLAGILRSENAARWRREREIDEVRATRFSSQVSRLRGMYFFRSKTEALERVGDPLWPKSFEENNLVELELYSDGAMTVVDANWVTYGGLQGGPADWIGAYWAGEPRRGRPAWELISGGVALVLSEDVRRRCFDKVKLAFPKCEIPILMARLAGEAGSRGGLIAPQVTAGHDGLRLSYLWNDADFQDPETIKRMQNHPDFGALARLVAAHEEWPIPDFRPWFAEVSWSAMGLVSPPG